MTSPQIRINPNTWVDKYSDYLFNYTIVRVNDREEAKDLISETFLAALKAKENFKGNASERTWLISILKRKIIDYYRKRNTKKGKAEVKIHYKDPDQEGDWLEEKVTNQKGEWADDHLENEELREAIYACMEKLSDKNAKIFQLKTVNKLDTEVICNEFGITSSNLWVILHRARLSLASCLKENWLK